MGSNKCLNRLETDSCVLYSYIKIHRLTLNGFLSSPINMSNIPLSNTFPQFITDQSMKTAVMIRQIVNVMNQLRILVWVLLF